MNACGKFMVMSSMPAKWCISGIYGRVCNVSNATIAEVATYISLSLV